MAKGAPVRVRDEQGQSAVEYLGALILAGLIIAGLLVARPGIGQLISTGLREAICVITGDECGSSEGLPPQVATDPHLTPDELAALAGPPKDAQQVAAGLTSEELRWLELNDPATYEAAKRAISYGEERALTDRYATADLDEFLEYRNSPERDQRLDWSTDHCSAPIVGSSGISFNFTDACVRHDFGYRNYERLDVFEEKKEAVDRQFLEDMKDHCRTRSIVLRLSCYRWAYTFYYAVKYFG